MSNPNPTETCDDVMHPRLAVLRFGSQDLSLKIRALAREIRFEICPSLALTQ